MLLKLIKIFTLGKFTKLLINFKSSKYKNEWKKNNIIFAIKN